VQPIVELFDVPGDASLFHRMRAQLLPRRGLFGAVYLMPVFLPMCASTMRFAIGKIMAGERGQPSLWPRPWPVRWRAGSIRVLLSAFGFALFCDRASA